MARFAKPVLAAGMVLALASCEALFTFNLFQAFDTPATPTAADYQGAGGLDRLAGDLSSPAVVSTLAADPVLVASIQSNLATDYLGGDPPASCVGAEAQEAAILYADLGLKTTEGEALVNNIVSAVVSGIDPSSTVADIIAGIIPPGAASDPATFSAMVNALLDANEAYLLLGASIDANSDGVADGTLPPDVAPGDVAQKAIVAYTMRKTVDAIMSGLPVATEAEAITEMFKVTTNDPTVDPGMAGITPDPFAAPDLRILALLDYANVPIP